MAQAFIILMLLILAASPALADDKQEIKAELLSLEQVKTEMISAGMNVDRVNDLMAEGFMQFNNNNYALAREAIASVYAVRDAAFETKKELLSTEHLYSGLTSRNITLANTTEKEIEMALGNSLREFEKENYEGALKTLRSTKATLLSIINLRYGYLENSIISMEEKIMSLKLSRTRITSLKALLTESLASGNLEELDVIAKEASEMEEALNYYQDIQSQAALLESRNLSLQRINDELNSAALDLDFGNYQEAISKLEKFKPILERAIKLYGEINGLEAKIISEKNAGQAQEAGAPGTGEGVGAGDGFKEAEIYLEKSRASLTIGSYEAADEQFKKAESSFEKQKAGLLVKKAGVGPEHITLEEFIRKNWGYITFIILVIAIMFISTHKTIVHHVRKKQAAKLEQEVKARGEMIKRLQREYFVHKKIGRESYDEAFAELHEKIYKAKDKLLSLEKKILNKKIKKQESKP